ncbi:RE2, partial [Symbiodinium microadriaticum]
MFTVAIDLAGPFKQKGRDMDHDDYKYLMVAAYRCPREYMSSKAISDYNAELYVPDEPDDPPDDPLALQEEELSEVEEGDKESGGDDAEETPQGRDEIEEEAEKLSKPQQAATIYLCRPLRRRTTAHVLQATKEIVVQLKQTGLHIAGLHSDRAREFKAKAFKDWVTDAGLKQTKTAGGDPSGNSTAELGIKWIKSRMRSLLRASDSPPRDWPMAASHATASLWGKAFPDSPSFHPPVTTFGNAVWFRAKSYKGTKEKKHEAAGTRWKKGWYKGPSMDVHRGHLIAREDGGLAIAKGVKFNVFDVKENPELRDLLPPAVAEGVPSEDKEDEFPPSKDELMEEIEFRARTMLDQSTVTINDILEIYYKLEGLGDTDRRIKNKAEVKSWFTGAFVHGGKAGPRINVEKFPYASKLLVEFGKQFAEGKSFSAVGIARNSQLGLHRDSHNDPTSSNIIVPLTSFEYGDLWIQDDGVQEEERVTKKLPNGKELKGRILPLEKGKATFFHPRVWHEVQPWKGDRVVLLMFTPRSSKLSQEDIAKLQEIGLEFPQLPEADEHDGQYSEDEESPIPVRVKMMSVQEEQMPYVFEEITDEDLLPGGGEHPLLPEEEGDEPADVRTMVGARLKKIIKKAEVQYTPDIEQVLHDLEAQGQQLQVTHTVNPQEVRKNLDLWKPSAVKEFRNLTEVKNALKVVKRNLLPPDCRIVPCKGVYTIKPDKGTPGYRRKTRLVACGNHVPEGETTFDLYAAGLDAASLRSVLAFSSSRDSWRFGVTDIRQAFVLARWLGGPVALQPPSVAFEWGLAQPGDMWLVQQAIYGLRESPAMWSQFRDEQLALARWNSVVDGKVVAMKLEQMVTDNQIWRIVREDGQGGTQGYLMVYIDDLLINAPDAVMWTFFEWLSAKWEVDELDVLDEGHPIKFLGTELHKVNGGVEMAQEGFVRELLRTYGHKGLRSKLQGPRETMILSDEEERALIEAEPVDTTGKEVIIKAVEGMVLGRAMKGLLDELSAKTAGGDVGDQRQKKLYVYGEYKGGESSFLLVVYIGDDVSGSSTPGIGASYAGIVDDDEGISSFVHRGTTTDGRVYATVMLKQMTAAEKERDGDQSPETVKPGTTTLPPLPAVRVETASVDIMDWLEMLTSPMSDLSDGSGLWWERVKSTATHSYVQWAQASPMERLKISPPRDEALESGKWSRVNSRASSMLMLALAEGVRSEMVARRLTGSATSILYRLMTLYQPAGEEEKMRILRNLQEPPQEGDPQRALEALRSWERWLRRCRELGVTAPDPALLARGLTAMVRKLMDQYPEASFRTSLVKSTLMVDTRPTMESVDGYYRHLLAECETLAVGLTSSTTSMQNTSTKPEPKMKPMKPEAATPIPPPPPLPTNRSSSQNTSGGEEGDKEKRATTPCRYFGKTFKGCARGSKCPFQHTWEGNEKEKAQRCWVCGGKHLTKQCPNQKPNPSTSSTTTPNAKATPQTPRTPPSSGTQTTTTKSVRIDDKPQVEQVPARTSSSSAAPEGSTPDIKEMLSDVGKMLKQMTAANAKKIAVVEQGFEQKLEEIEAAMKLSMVEAEDDAMDGLLDSGATHAMRVAEGNEYETGSSVKVTLAGEDVREMRQNLQGTVLIENDGRQAVQPIVALGAVIEDLDCSLSWRRGSFQLRHPEKGVLKVKLVNNCPEIKAKDALALIKELENKHMVKLTHQVEDLKARLEVLRKEETRSRDNILKEYVKNGSQALLLRAILVCPFTKDLPEDVQAMIAEGFEEHHGLNYLKQLPLTRRKRKLLLASNQWVVVFNQGATENAEEPINAMAKQGKVVLYVDPSSSRLWDVHRKSGVYQMLLWAASQGKIADVLASPPSATWTTAMSEQMGQDVASMRTKAHPYGHDGLPPLKQQLLNNETAAVAKCMMLWLVATMSGKGNVGFLLEQYSPGDELRSDDSGSISLWSTQLWKSFKALTGMSQVSFYMGAIGHRGKRPTGMATNYPRLCQIEGMCDFVDGALPTTLMDVKEMKTWSVKFQEIVAQAACESLNGVFADEEELTQLDVKLSKLTKEQK